MTDTGADMHIITLEKGLATFLKALSGKNRSTATIRAYATDVAQFISFFMPITCRFIPPQMYRKLMSWSISPRLPNGN